MPELFSPQPVDSGSELDAEKQELYRQNGQMKVEMEFLNKTLGRVDWGPARMHRSQSQGLVDRPAVRVVGGSQGQLLLLATAGARRDASSDAEDRRALHGTSVSGQPANCGHAQPEPEVCATAHAADGDRSPLPETANQRPQVRCRSDDATQ